MLEADHREIVYQDYTASMLKTLAQSFLSFAGAQVELPSFIEMMYPEQAPKGPQTKQEIIEHVLKLFTE